MSLTESQDRLNKAALTALAVAHQHGCSFYSDARHFWNEAGFCECGEEQPPFPAIPVLCEQCGEEWTPDFIEVGEWGWCPDCSASYDDRVRTDAAARGFRL